MDRPGLPPSNTEQQVSRMMFPGSSGGMSSTRFYSASSRNGTTSGTSSSFFSGSRDVSMTTVTDALGQISGQISNLQQCMVSLSSTVENLSSKTEELTSRVAALEDVAIETQPAKKRKIDVPRDLSTQIKRIYRELPEEKKFHTNEKVSSSHNVSTVDHLVRQVLTSEKYTDEHCISVASKKYFESQVRASKEVSVDELKKKRMTSRRAKLFDRRSKFVCSNERELWGQLTAAYMSDEETDTENEGFIVRKLSWRSTLVDRLITKLDERYNSSRAQNTNSKPRSTRRLGSPSQRAAPIAAPQWARSESVMSPVVPSPSTLPSADCTSIPVPQNATTPRQQRIVTQNTLTPNQQNVPMLSRTPASAPLPLAPLPLNTGTPRRQPVVQSTSTPTSSFITTPRIQLQFDNNEEDDPEWEEMIMNATRQM